MPTQRKRHMISESDRLTQALAAVAVRWPELSEDSGKQLRKVLEVGIEQLLAETDAARTQRLIELSSAAGSLTDVWPGNWRSDLRDEWPA